MMIEYIIDLWIIIDHGTLIFNKTDTLDIDDQCFGGLLSAFYSFTHTLHETLFKFYTDKYRYYIIKQDGILFAGRFSLEKIPSEKNILKELSEIRKKFFQRYSIEEIENRDHDISKFADFQDHIKPKNELIGNFLEQSWDHSLNKNQI